MCIVYTLGDLEREISEIVQAKKFTVLSAVTQQMFKGQEHIQHKQLTRLVLMKLAESVAINLKKLLDRVNNSEATEDIKKSTNKLGAIEAQEVLAMLQRKAVCLGLDVPSLQNVVLTPEENLKVSEYLNGPYTFGDFEKALNGFTKNNHLPCAAIFAKTIFANYDEDVKRKPLTRSWLILSVLLVVHNSEVYLHNLDLSGEPDDEKESIKKTSYKELLKLLEEIGRIGEYLCMNISTIDSPGLTQQELDELTVYIHGPKTTLASE